MNSVVTLAGALVAGAGLAHFLDPDRGRRRRALVRDQLVSAAHAAGDAADAASRDFGNRVRGTLAGVRSRVAAGNVDDDVLVERVRARMGGVVSHPRAIDVFAEDGCVTLQGPVLAREVGRLVRRVTAVPGVRRIDNRLEVHRRADDVPALQGMPRRRFGRRAYVRRATPIVRVAAGAVGAVLALYGMRTAGLIGTVAGLGGLAAVTRAFANRDADAGGGALRSTRAA
ncbi:MAG TPA: BON domain-containing protein [Terriglobales bacterium]|nr:BON domain-containing protein [Terriglobales bacterium]